MSHCHSGSPRLPPKISKTTPCKVAGGRRNRRFEPILDTSGKSAALLHHRKIRSNDRGRATAAVRCDVGRSSLTYDRTLHGHSFNASMRSYSACVTLRTSWRRKSKAAIKRRRAQAGDGSSSSRWPDPRLPIAFPLAIDTQYAIANP
jgi:hypothetical protein